ncbi:MAG: type II toxin-antitoxin system RelE/ParE family toxin [Thermoguttaceae bacterium]|jgi:toxin ParE1/3/4
MKKQLFFSPHAEADLDAILEFIAKDKPVAAASFVEKLREKCFMLAANPELGELRPDLAENLRCFSFRNYVIFYRSVQNGVEIIRVASGFQNIEMLF